MPAQQQWARLKGEANCGLRRGAWYRVLSLTSTEGIVDVKAKRVSVPRSSLEIALTPPQTWTVVNRPRNAPSLPANWGDKYAVCPSCRTRAAIRSDVTNLRCSRCNGLFSINWGI